MIFITMDDIDLQLPDHPSNHTIAFYQLHSFPVKVVRGSSSRPALKVLDRYADAVDTFGVWHWISPRRGTQLSYSYTRLSYSIIHEE